MNPGLNWTISTITNLAQVGYTGKIEINLFQGGISGINFNQSIKPLQEVRVIPLGKEAHISLN